MSYVNKKFAFVFAAALLAAVALPFALHAEITFTPSESLPPLPGGQQFPTTGGFPQFVRWLVPFTISVAAILAVIMIIVAGLRWMAAAGNPSQIETAKNNITNAVFGLVLAFAAWLILNTINPALVNPRLHLDLLTPTQRAARESEEARTRAAGDVFRGQQYERWPDAEPNAYCILNTPQDFSCPEGSYASGNSEVCGVSPYLEAGQECRAEGTNERRCCILGERPDERLSEHDVGGVQQQIPQPSSRPAIAYSLNCGPANQDNPLLTGSPLQTEERAGEAFRDIFTNRQCALTAERNGVVDNTLPAPRIPETQVSCAKREEGGGFGGRCGPTISRTALINYGDAQLASSGRLFQFCPPSGSPLADELACANGERYYQGPDLSAEGAGLGNKLYRCITSSPFLDSSLCEEVTDGRIVCEEGAITQCRFERLLRETSIQTPAQ